MPNWKAGLAASAAALLFAAPVVAANLAVGDGSAFDNIDLVADPGPGCPHCAPTPPVETFDPLFDPDWSLALRGSVSVDGAGGDPSYQLIALPSLTLRQETIRGGYDLSISGEIVAPLEDDVRLASLRTGIAGTYALDAVTRLGARADLTVSQDDADNPLIAASLLVVTGALEASVTRELGLFELGLRANAARTVNGETVYADDTTSGNDYDNTTSFGVGSRLAVGVAPGLAAFIDLEAAQESYDEASPSLMVKLDNLTYAARAGLRLRQGELFEGEASLGIAHRDFADESIADASALLYGASLTFRPDETLQLTASLATTLGAPGSTSGSSAELTYAAGGEVAFQANSWLRLRGSASWEHGRFLGTDIEKRSWSAGLGADYLLNRNTDITADYTFERSETTPAPASDAHQVMLGVRFHR